MPHYFFDLTDGCAKEADEYGLDLASDTDAVREAVAGARSILADADRTGECFRACAMEIRCDDGRFIGNVPFTQAVRTVVLRSGP